jgi:DNA-binding response OmpR family regulator
MGSVSSVLIIEDDFFVRELLKFILETQDYCVDCCSCAEEALRKAARRTYDLLVSDLNLPGISGLEMIRKIRELQPTLPILAITGIEFSAVEEVKRAGACDALLKPFSCTQFERAVSKCLLGKLNN